MTPACPASFQMVVSIHNYWRRILKPKIKDFPVVFFFCRVHPHAFTTSSYYFYKRSSWQRHFGQGSTLTMSARAASWGEPAVGAGLSSITCLAFTVAPGDRPSQRKRRWKTSGWIKAMPHGRLVVGGTGQGWQVSKTRLKGDWRPTVPQAARSTTLHLNFSANVRV